MSLNESFENAVGRIRERASLAHGARFPMTEYWPSVQERMVFASERLARLLAAEEAAAEVDLQTRMTVRKGVTAMAVAAFIFAAFQSESFTSYTRDLPGNAVTDRMVRAADGWHMMMQALGPAEISQQVKNMTAAIHDFGADEG